VINKSSTRQLAKGGMLLGAIERTAYEEERVHLEPGDLLLFFTDGLTEAENKYGDAFGEDRLIDTARSAIDLSSSDIVRRIHSEIWNFSDGRLVDDFTLLVIKAK
jgi:sigma-B regulation protein RsbU (phosphoserine phosphatase)